jgi:hypothetical protein
VFVGFLDLFWTIETVRESLGPEVLYLFLYAFILFLVNRNAIIDILIFVASASVHVRSVAYIRFIEFREHHSLCFMNYFVA